MKSEFKNTKIKSIVLILLSLIFLSINTCFPEQLTKAKFYELLNGWKTAIENDPVILSDSFFRRAREHTLYKELVSYKVQCIPFLLQEIKKEGRNMYGSAFFAEVMKISKRTPPERHRDLCFSLGMSEAKHFLMNQYIQWWENEKYLEEQKEFEELYAQLKQATSEEEKKKILTEIRNIGIAPLENAVEKIKAGDTDLVEIVNYWADEEIFGKPEEGKMNVSKEVKQEKVSQWWSKNKENWTFPKPKEESQ